MPKLNQVLSPETNQCKDRLRRGRVAYQFISDTLSYGANVSQRILLLDHLVNLPAVLFSLTRDVHIHKILSSEKRQEVFEWTQCVTREEIEDLLTGSVLAFEGICGGDLNDPDVSLNLGHQLKNSREWWIFLFIARPHIERKIWLTDISFPHPFYGLARLQDVWAIIELFWMFNRIKNGAIGNGFLDGVCHIPDLSFNYMSLEGSNAPNAQVVVGPYIQTNNNIVSNASIENSNARISKIFFRLIRTCADVLPGWGKSDELLPNEDEVIDAIKSNLRPTNSDIVGRAAVLIKAWGNLLSIHTCIDDFTRDEWESLGSVSVFIIRKRKKLIECFHGSEFSMLIAGGRLVLLVTLGDKDKMELHHREFGKKYSNTLSETHLYERVNQSDGEIVEYPNVLYNRMRERRAGYWNYQILALNNMLQRSNLRQVDLQSSIDLPKVSLETNTGKNVNAQSTIDDIKETLLLGFGTRLCRYITSLTQADLCTIYWLDYSDSPGKLNVVGTYSYNRALRAETNSIHFEFASEVDRQGYRESRIDSGSLLYRTVANNIADIVSDTDSLVLSGFPVNQMPRTTLAHPICYNGRVIGVIELKGLSSKQFSKTLFSPLMKIANVIGPFMYHNLFIWQLNSINYLITTKFQMTWLHRRNNPLREISKIICNIFLCSSANIWIKDYDNSRFNLKGSSKSSIYKSFVRYEGVAPTVRIDRSGRKYRLTKPFATLAISLWENEEAWGRFVKAKYFDTDPPSNSGIEDILHVAQKRGVKVYRNFVFSKSTLRETRKRMLVDEGLCEFMCFPLVRQVHSAVGAAGKRHSIQGFVYLHDYGDSLGESIGYSLGWAPVVSFVQSHLTHLLEQLELLHVGWHQARNILIHEIKHVVELVERRHRRASRQYFDLTEGHSRDRIRQWIQKLPIREEDQRKLVFSPDDYVSLYSDLKRIQNSVLAAGKSSSFMNGMSERLGRFNERLQNRKSFELLDINPGEEQGTIDVSEDIQDQYRSHRDEFDEKGIHDDLTRISPILEIRLERTIWERVTYNLLANMSKYSRNDSVVTIRSEGSLLIWENLAPYHIGDVPERLCRLGERGNLVEEESGDGTGLWVVSKACALAGIQFSLDIERLNRDFDDQEPLARYKVTLDLRSILSNQFKTGA